ncbi:fungal-specific transcription factor domain-containing protein [Colletotrichum phormii]|uniref:Fungal-specific transcription factor domain-containing protein n=1 Tax=Colletotrichum phormii TaxID=359342 RepID=A0AAJ0E8B4_9PEZI|nr:fungal-specific transcription factor domain-containing protein [Colletotrichum phormii]KAK1621480.1 fungal-specific transcription factor domain-containing protein [Colletotrichum phormii]
MESATAEAPPIPRKPACVLCKSRKVKCDRESPACGGCVKLGAECVPRENSKTRNRKKPNVELQRRLARCEELLQQFVAAEKREGSSDSTRTEPSPKSDTSTKSETQDRSRDQEMQAPENSLGKLVIDNGSVRFTDSTIWATVFDELQAMRAAVDNADSPSSLPSLPEATIQQPSIANDAGIMNAREPRSGNPQPLHPPPSHAMLLWRMFLDRVNPITKLIHVPSAQRHLVQAMTTPPSLPRDMEVLFFSIYACAVGSMRQEECTRLLGQSRIELLNRFSRTLRTGLYRARFLEKPTLLLLQALVLQLIAIPDRESAHANWVMSGVCIRSAQRLGLHRDGSQLGLSPFETELRRRVWWHIVLLDFRFAMASGFNPTPLSRACSCKMPTNINDADFDVDTATPLENSDGPTEMIACLVVCNLSRCLTQRSTLSHAMFVVKKSAVADELSRAHSIELEKFVVSSEKCLEDIVERYCDPSAGNLHVTALQLKNAMVNKIRIMACKPKGAVEPPPEEKGDILFRVSLEAAEHVVNQLQVMEGWNFVWFVLQYLEYDLFLHLISRLCLQSTGDLVDRAWTVLPVIYHYQEDYFEMSVHPYAVAGAVLVRAWRHRQESLPSQLGYLPPTPDYVQRIEQCLAANSSVGSSPPELLPPSGETAPDTTGFEDSEWGWNLPRFNMDSYDLEYVVGEDSLAWPPPQ